MTGAPEIVIEIASRGTRTRDETIKKRLYERCGVEEYWVVACPERAVAQASRRDPQRGAIRVYVRGEGGFNKARELSAEAGDVLTTTLLPALEVPLARIFAAANS